MLMERCPLIVPQNLRESSALLTESRPQAFKQPIGKAHTQNPQMVAQRCHFAVFANNTEYPWTNVWYKIPQCKNLQQQCCREIIHLTVQKGQRET